jgi:hypothetical protein
MVSLSLLSLPTQAAQTGTLTLSGVVDVVNEIVVTPNAQATNLDILGGQSNLTVASVSETSNNLAGYRIELFSANAGELVHESDSTKKTDYRISYDGAKEITPPAAGAPVTVKTVTSLNELTTTTSDIQVGVTAFPSAPAGTYSDTVTLSIIAN